MTTALPPVPRRTNRSLLSTRRSPQSQCNCILRRLVIYTTTLNATAGLSPHRRSRADIVLRRAGRIVTILRKLPPGSSCSPRRALKSIDVLTGCRTRVDVTLRHYRTNRIDSRPDRGSPSFVHHLLTSLALTLGHLSTWPDCNDILHESNPRHRTQGTRQRIPQQSHKQCKYEARQSS